MALSWTYTLSIEPTAALGAWCEGNAVDSAGASRLTRRRHWTLQSPGDHDYEGQHAHALRRAKLVFLAQMFAVSADAQTEQETRETLERLRAGTAVSVELFDRYWRIVPFHRFGVGYRVIRFIPNKRHGRLRREARGRIEAEDQKPDEQWYERTVGDRLSLP